MFSSKVVFFPFTVLEWNYLDLNICKSENIASFRNKLLQFVCRSGSGIYICRNPEGAQLLRLCLSHLREHNFRYNFQDTVNCISNCSENIKTTCHCLFHFSIYSKERLTPLSVIDGLDTSILEKKNSEKTEVLLYEKSSLIKTSNIHFLKARQKV